VACKKRHHAKSSTADDCLNDFMDILIIIERTLGSLPVIELSFHVLTEMKRK
jgi:hypothetical protein